MGDVICKKIYLIVLQDEVNSCRVEDNFLGAPAPKQDLKCYGSERLKTNWVRFNYPLISALPHYRAKTFKLIINCQKKYTLFFIIPYPHFHITVQFHLLWHPVLYYSKHCIIQYSTHYITLWELHQSFTLSVCVLCQSHCGRNHSL